MAYKITFPPCRSSVVLAQGVGSANGVRFRNPVGRTRVSG
jgi:hypothetical protein